MKFDQSQDLAKCLILINTELGNKVAVLLKKERKRLFKGNRLK